MKTLLRAFSAITILIVVSCKKEETNTEAPIVNDHISMEYSPFLQIGIPNDSTLDEDTVITHGFDFNNDGDLDIVFVIDERTDYIITPSQDTHYLPFKEIAVISNNPSNVHIGNYFLDTTDVIDSTTFVPHYTHRLLARLVPAFYLGFSDNRSVYLPFRIKQSSKWHYGWIKFHTTGAEDWLDPRTVIFFEAWKYSLIPEQEIMIN